MSESDEWSGGAAQLLALAEGLRGRGWEARIACRPGSGLDKNASARGFATFYAGFAEDYDLISAWRLASYVQKEAIGVVHAHHNRSHAVCLLAKLLSRLRGGDFALVVSRRVSFPPGRNPFSRWKYRSRLIDRIVAVAAAVKEVLVDSGVDPEKVSVIRSGVDLGRFTPKGPDPAFRRGLGAPDDRVLIGKVANASPWKGQTVLLDAAALLAAKGRPFHLLFAGRDTDAPWMKEEVSKRNLNDRVTLLGFRTDIPEILSCLSISVNAAVRGEGLSGALRESLAMGVPVVASDIAGNRELLKEEGKEFLFKPGDARGLAERLEWALDQREAAKRFVDAWRERAHSEFSLEQTIARTDALYRTLLTSRAARS